LAERDTVRRQLTLFVAGRAAADIDDVRQRVDPVQFGLIAAHVTLCREDELAELSERELARRLAQAAPAPLTLVFGPPTRFGDHGMMLPCLDGAEAFHTLRQTVLGTTDIRAHEAHLTLAHPRNPRAPANIAASYAALQTGLTVTFIAVALIEQRHAHPWVVRATVPLDRRHDRVPSSPPS